MKHKLLNVAVEALLLLISVNATAQCIIRGTINDDLGKPVPYANVLLLHSPDSSLAKGAITNSGGYFEFKNIKKGNYIVAVSHANMITLFKALKIVPEIKEFNIGALSLTPITVELGKVTVQAPPPMFEEKIDRMVINVQNSIVNTTGSVLDVLEKSPGITVDRQNNSISINGKSGVEVMLNGKLTYMPLDALVELLDGTSAADVQRIEIITTPPSKYDAAGNAGYINIVFIKNPDDGINGSYYITAGYGKRPLAAAGINFNDHYRKLNLYGNYSYSLDQFVQTSQGLNQFTSNGKLISQDLYTTDKPVRQVNSLQFGLDYHVDSATTISALVRGYDFNWSNASDNGARILTNNTLDTIIATTVHEKNNWDNLMTNLNFLHSFRHGSTVSADANYIYYYDNHPDDYFNKYFDGSKQFLYDEMLRTFKTTPINFYVFSADYISAPNEKVRFEGGTKVSLTGFHNDIGLERFKQNLWMTDANLSANYKLRENIWAGYGSFTIKASEATTIKAGLRYEYTVSMMGTTSAANVVNRKYGNFFPTFFLSRKINASNSVSISYSRRITRPTFNDLAPFTIFFDPKTFFYGNPTLLPSIANTVQTIYSYKDFLFSLNYTYENNTIEHFQTQRIDTISNLVYVSARNFKYEKYFTASFSLPFSVTHWWSMQNNLNFNWHQINTTYEGKNILLGIYYYNIRSTQNFLLPKYFSLELTGAYTSDSYFGTSTLKPVYRVDAGLQKKFANKNDILKFTANDIFNSGSHYRYYDNLPVKGTIINGSLNFGNTSFKLIYTQTFGNKNLKNKHNRTTGAEEELERLHN